MKKYKKAQVYGLNTFIYAIAISLLLIISLVGLSKDMESSANIGFTRFTALSATRTGETIKSLIDQERAYAVDKSLFVTGAFGGYSIYGDMICNSTQGYCNCDAVSGIDSEYDFNVSDCISHNSNCIWEPYCDSEEYPITGCRSGKLDQCYPEIGSCGIRILNENIPHIASKTVPYWERYNRRCIPSEFKIQEVFMSYLDTLSGSLDPLLEYALREMAYPNPFGSFTYLSIISSSDINSNRGTILTRWVPIGSANYRIFMPAVNPIAEYSFDIYSEIYTQTEFFNLFQESRDSVTQKYFERHMNDTRFSPIPTIIDYNQPVFVQQSDGKARVCNCNDFPNYDDIHSQRCHAGVCIEPGVTCITDSSLCVTDIIQNPLRTLAHYIITHPELYPNQPNTCNMPSMNSITDDVTCSVHATNINGELIIANYHGECNQTPSTNSKDAIKCVMTRTINRINQELLQGPPIRKNVASQRMGATIECVGSCVDGDFYQTRLNHVINERDNVYTETYGYGYTTNQGEAMQINLTEIYSVNRIKLHFWDGNYSKSGTFSPSVRLYNSFIVEGSVDGDNWITLVEGKGNHSGVEEFEFQPTQVGFIRINGTNNTVNNQFHIVNFEAYTTIDYRYEILDFALQYEGGTLNQNLLYNATDISVEESRGDAPEWFVEDSIDDCVEAECIGDMCYNFPGEPCPCCGEELAGTPLYCCTPSHAHTTYRNKCWNTTELGKVYFGGSANTVVSKCSSPSVSVRGMCQGYVGRNIILESNATGSWHQIASNSVSSTGGRTFSMGMMDTPGKFYYRTTVSFEGENTGDNQSIFYVDVTPCGEIGEPACKDSAGNYLSCHAGYENGCNRNNFAYNDGGDICVSLEFEFFGENEQICLCGSVSSCNSALNDFPQFCNDEIRVINQISTTGDGIMFGPSASGKTFDCQNNLIQHIPGGDIRGRIGISSSRCSVYCEGANCPPNSVNVNSCSDIGCHSSCYDYYTTGPGTPASCPDPDNSRCDNNGDGGPDTCGPYSLSGRCVGHNGFYRDLASVSGVSDVTIKNCRITEFERGVYLRGVNNSLIQNITAYQNRLEGLRMDFSRSNTILRSNFSQNILHGIRLDKTNNTIIQNSIITHNVNTSNTDVWHFSHGIVIQDNSRNNTVFNNTISNNNRDGIRVSNSLYTNITANHLINNRFGIHLSTGAHNSTLHSNNASSRSNIAGGGMYIYTSHNLVRNNTANNNGHRGIFVQGGTGNQVINNTANNNGLIALHPGIEIRAGASNNNISYNIANNNNLSGIYVYSSNNNVLTHNSVNSNIVYGIALFDSNLSTININNASNNYVGIVLSDSYNNSLNRNKAVNNVDGVVIGTSGTTGLGNLNSRHNTILNTNASHNTERGIRLMHVSSNTILNLTANNNGKYGLEFWYAPNNQINYQNILYHSYIQNNTESGIRVHRSDGVKIFRSTISNNGLGSSGIRDGITVQNSNNFQFQHLNLYSNRRHNIRISDSIGGSVSDSNLTSAIIYEGIYMVDSNQTSISRNNISLNNRSGISVLRSNNTNIISNVDISRNGRMGIHYLSVRNSTIFNNTIRFNDGHNVQMRLLFTKTYIFVQDNRFACSACPPSQNAIAILLCPDDNWSEIYELTGNTLHGGCCSGALVHSGDGQEDERCLP